MIGYTEKQSEQVDRLIEEAETTDAAIEAVAAFLKFPDEQMEFVAEYVTVARTGRFDVI